MEFAPYYSGQIYHNRGGTWKSATILLGRPRKPGRIFAALVRMQHQDVATRPVGPETFTADNIGAWLSQGDRSGSYPSW